MKKQIFLIILLLTCQISIAQNLVPNGDFEQYSGCSGQLIPFRVIVYYIAFGSYFF